MKDGIYLELFVTKNGIKYPLKTFSLQYFIKVLTNSLMDGIENVVNVPLSNEKGDN